MPPRRLNGQSTASPVAPAPDPRSALSNSHPPDTSVPTSIPATIRARDRMSPLRDNATGGPQPWAASAYLALGQPALENAFRPPGGNHGLHACSDRCLRARAVHSGDRPTLRVRPPPLRPQAGLERRTHALVKIYTGPLDSVTGAARSILARKTTRDWKDQHDREIGNESVHGQLVGRAHEIGRKATPRHLIGIGRQKEAIGDDRRAGVQVVPDLGHQLGPRSKKQEDFGSRLDLRSLGEKQSPDLLAEPRCPWLANDHHRYAGSSDLVGESRDLRRLSRSLGALDDNKSTASGGRPTRHPSVMMGLVAPRLIPSRIHVFTRIISLSKLSCAVTAR